MFSKLDRIIPRLWVEISTLMTGSSAKKRQIAAIRHVQGHQAEKPKCHQEYHLFDIVGDTKPKSRKAAKQIGRYSTWSRTPSRIAAIALSGFSTWCKVEWRHSIFRLSVKSNSGIRLFGVSTWFRMHPKSSVQYKGSSAQARTVHKPEPYNKQLLIV